ncbi:MAG: ShlB/FhaC/HecB family hemolysin secretion/activation protein [Nitrospirae bacterium]|nr:ShlB/FhaC/HecB family hemolysin secretion/activation protein [Nitrospirota bacterium]
MMKNLVGKKIWGFLLIFLLVIAAAFIPVNGFSEDLTGTVHVKEFSIIGNKAMDTDDIHACLEDYKDKDYTLDGLKDIADRITDLYQQEGYVLAKAYIPKQEIEDGIVTIAVVEGELGFIEITDNKYYTSEYVKNWFSHLKRDAVREQDIERAILLVNDTKALKVTTAFKRGKKPGTADLIVKVEDSYPLSLDLNYDNHGNPLISRGRMGFNLQTGMSPFSGSELNIKGVMGERFDKTFYGLIDYQTPIGYQGARWGLRYLYADYLVGGDLEILGLEGESQILGGYLSYPFVKTKKHNLTATMGFDYKHMFETDMDVQKSNDDLSVGYVRLDYDAIDRFLGDKMPAKNYLSLTYSHGFNSVFGSIKENDPDSSNFGADGNFDKYNLDVVRVQKMWKDIIVLTKGSGQYSNAILTSGEKFSIGGANSVRGTRLGEFVGEKGYLASLEISSSYPFIWLKNFLLLGKKISDEDVKKTIRAVAFGDHAGVFEVDNGEDPTIGKAEDNYLSSIGVGARIYLFDRLDLKFDVGYPFRTSEFHWGDEIIYLSVNYNAVKF